MTDTFSCREIIIIFSPDDFVLTCFPGVRAGFFIVSHFIAGVIVRFSYAKFTPNAILLGTMIFRCTKAVRISFSPLQASDKMRYISMIASHIVTTPHCFFTCLQQIHDGNISVLKNRSPVSQHIAEIYPPSHFMVSCFSFVNAIADFGHFVHREKTSF